MDDQVSVKQNDSRVVGSSTDNHSSLSAHESVNSSKLQKVLADQSGSSTSLGRVLLKLFFHSVAMFCLPFFTYWGIKDYAEKEYEVQSPRSYIYGAVGAVIVVHIIIASYIYQAFKEEQFSKTVNKKIS